MSGIASIAVAYRFQITAYYMCTGLYGGTFRRWPQGGPLQRQGIFGTKAALLGLP